MEFNIILNLWTDHYFLDYFCFWSLTLGYMYGVVGVVFPE
jgi:hypothetical protein